MYLPVKLPLLLFAFLCHFITPASLEPSPQSTVSSPSDFPSAEAHIDTGAENAIPGHINTGAENVILGNSKTSKVAQAPTPTEEIHFENVTHRKTQKNIPSIHSTDSQGSVLQNNTEALNSTNSEVNSNGETIVLLTGNETSLAENGFLNVTETSGNVTLDDGGLNNMSTASSTDVIDETTKQLNDTRDSVQASESTVNSTSREDRKFLDDETAYVLNTQVPGSAEGQEVSTAQSEEPNLEGKLPVRKCCEIHQYFSLLTQQCEDADMDTGFGDIVLELLQTPDSTKDLHYISGRLQECPGTGMLPSISEAKVDTHTITDDGHLMDHMAHELFDHNHYCLELAAQTSEELINSVLVSAWCQMWPSEVLARKCCEVGEYFDHVHGNCRSSPDNFTDHETLVHQFLRTDPLVGSIHVEPGRLICDGGTPKIVGPQDVFLDSSGQLCEFHTGHCYPPKLYCLENLWAEEDEVETPVASVCPVDSFHKCCPGNEILTETGCTPSESQYMSARMIQLLEVLEPQYGFPTENGGDLCVQEWITPDDEDLRWWISKTGYLSVDTHTDSTDTMQYCVDDFHDPDDSIHTVAIMCHSKLEELVHVALSSHPSESGSISKCCPHRFYFNMATSSCDPDDKGLLLETEPQMQAANVTKLTYTSFPECLNPDGYHQYYLDPESNDDYAFLTEGLDVEVVSTDGRCVISRRSYERGTYCIEYAVNGSDMRPSIFVCPERWVGADVHAEKFGLTAVLLGLSCAALVATAFSLISTRVRRGLVTVKKVNTLAGRILLSYVLSYLVGFLLLAVNMKVEVTRESAECHTMAYLLIFFLLAAFQWNTSICLESLLLTLRVSISEGRRYVYHSLWAWGVPLFITVLALILDTNRQNLPCGVITPKVGVFKCFFSDPDAKLVYLYVPMLITLLANTGLLLAARYVRSAKLQRLEQGPAKTRPSEVDMNERQESSNKNGNGNSNNNGTTPQSSGMRTHQTRNIWSESVKLVLWSGGTWLLEVLSFIIAQYAVTPSESWYDYLWYVPSSVNALRGVGIFFILVLTPENRLKLSRWLNKMGFLSLAKNVRSSADGGRSTIHNPSSVGGTTSENSEVRTGRDRCRNMSIATTISQLSSIRSSQSDSRADNRGGSSHPSLAHSISQVDNRRSSVSSQSSEFEGYELDTEIGAAAGKRKASLANIIPSLPSVNEEDDVAGIRSDPDEAADTASEA